MDMTKRLALMCLKNIVDPEVGLDIISMGLVYGLEVTPEAIQLRLTLTTPGCPIGATILGMVGESLGGIAGGRKVDVQVVWEPPWSPKMLSQEAKENIC